MNILKIISLLIILVVIKTRADSPFISINLSRLKIWADSFGEDIDKINEESTCSDLIQDKYIKKAKVKKRKTEETLQEIIREINQLFTKKRAAVTKIVKDAEAIAAAHSREQQRLYKEKSNNYQSNSEDQNIKKNEVDHNPPSSTSNFNLKSTTNSNIPTINYNELDKVDSITKLPDFYPKLNIKPESENEVLKTEETTKKIDDNSVVTKEKSKQSRKSNKFRKKNREKREDDMLKKMILNDLIIKEELNIIDSTSIENKTTDFSIQTENLDYNFNAKNITKYVIEKNAEQNTKQNTEQSIEVNTETNTQQNIKLNEYKEKLDEVKLIGVKDKDDFLLFNDMKKIYSPRKILSNSSLPRAAPNEDSDEEETQEYYERWRLWTPLKTFKNNLFPTYRLNLSSSGLHVPLNVYPQHNNTRNAIEWSHKLDETFKKNRKTYPYLNFQFFCSIDGFLRIYPLVKWRVPKLFVNGEKFKNLDDLDDQPENYEYEPEDINDDEVDDNDPSRSLDLYDCRLRDWFIKAAAAPKDIIVMMDSSGSMRGERSKIAQNVLINVLETLTENDYVSVVRFNTSLYPIDNCFGKDFVQASKRNVAKFKDEILDLGDESRIEESKSFANFTNSLREAFELFNSGNLTHFGTGCSKALMLITDGTTENLDKILTEFNSNKTIRIFTYLIGREVTHSANTESIACKNFGYFTHLRDLAEVKEEVQLYVPVLSRPIGLHVRDATVVYSSVYADPILPPLTDMIWEMYENKLFHEINTHSKCLERQSRSKRSVHNKGQFLGSFDRTESEREKIKISVNLMRNKRQTDRSNLQNVATNSADNCVKPMLLASSEKVEADLMITMAMPVFNMTNGTQTSWDLLGVAGVDVPIKEILKEILFYRLGVGGYPFIVNNNGFLIYHPDMRPVYKGFLKRFYTSLDILEVELVDDNRRPRDENPTLLAMRKSIIDEKTDCSILASKLHYDSMKRATARKNHFCWITIPETLFTLVISLPNDYGHYYVKAYLEVLPHKDYSQLLEMNGHMWFVHPRWQYCWDNLYNPTVNNLESDEKMLMEMSPEEIIMHFLNYNLHKPDAFAWKLFDTTDNDEDEKVEFFCNKQLIGFLLFDAYATRVDHEKCHSDFRSKTNHSVKIVNSYISTRSGFSRFYNFTPDHLEYQHRTNSIDDVVYKKSVDYSVKYKSDHFVFQSETVFDRMSIRNTLITATKAFFLKVPEEEIAANIKSDPNVNPEENKAPYLITGLQFSYESLTTFFYKHSSICSNGNCAIDCTINEINCYLIDDNGIVVISVNDFSEKIKLDATNNDCGKLFSELDNVLFTYLVEKLEIFRKIEIYDFQGICEQDLKRAGSSSSKINFINPLKFIWKILILFFKQAIYSLNTLVNFDQFKFTLADYDDEEIDVEKGVPNRTIVDACLKIHDLYELNYAKMKEHKIDKEPLRVNEYCTDGPCLNPFIIYKVPNTNFILLVADNIYKQVLKKREPRIEVENGDTCHHHEPMYRRQPYMYEDHMCYPNKEETNIQHCGASSAQSIFYKVAFTYFISFIFCLLCVSYL